MDDMTIPILAFFKFGTQENLLKLMTTGEVYFNTITAFSELDDEFRGDRFEGASRVLRGDRIEKLIYRSPTGDIVDFKKDVQVKFLIDRPTWEGMPTHIFCLHMLADRDYGDGPVIDERNLQFGAYALGIDNPKEFVRRIGNSLRIAGLAWQGNNVKYVESSQIHGNYDFFTKPDSYAYQKEFRFLVASDSKLPLKLQIGSLEDISRLMTAEEIKSIRQADTDD